MKLRKILAGFLAGAVAMSSMVVTSITASAESKIELLSAPITVTASPELENDSYNYTEQISGYKYTNTIKSKHYSSVTIDYSVAADSNLITHGFSLVVQGGTASWKTASNWYVAAGDNQTLTYDFTELGENGTFQAIAFQASGLADASPITGLTINSIYFTPSAYYVAPTLPENKYDFSPASGSATAGTYGQPAYAEVGADKTITPEVLAEDFVVVAPYTESTIRPLFILSNSDSTSDLNWIQIEADIVIDGTAYFISSDAVAAWTAAGGSEDLSDVKKIYISAGAEAMTVSGAALYSEYAPISSYEITSIQTNGGSFAVTLNDDPDSTEVITEAEAGDEVYIFFNPNIGYELTAYMIMGDVTDEYYANENSDESEGVSDVESITFEMPEEPVTIVAYFGKASYDVTVLPYENGTVFADYSIASYGDEIKITATPSSGYEVSSIVVKNDTTGETIATTDTFLMPDSDVTVEVTFTAADAEKFNIAVAATTNGTVTPTVTTAAEGTSVALAVEPAVGYELDDIKVQGVSGVTYDVSSFVFIMPAENVTVTATFKEIAEETDPTIWEDTADMGTDWGTSVTVGDITVAEGDTLVIHYTIGSAASYQQLKLMANDPAGWAPLTSPTTNDWDCVELAAGTTSYEFSLNAADAAALTKNGLVVSGYNVTVTKIELIPSETSGFDQTSAEFTADDAGTIVSQTATINGKTAKRFTMLVGIDAIKKAEKATFTLNNGTTTKTYETTKYYASLTASGTTVNAPAGYGFVTLTITDIPDGVTVTCEKVELTVKA